MVFINLTLIVEVLIVIGLFSDQRQKNILKIMSSY